MFFWPARIPILSGILGPHRVGDDLVVRVFRPDAKEVSIVLPGEDDQRFAAVRLSPEGFFQATLPGSKRDIDYRVHLTGWDGTTALVRDPYSYGLDHGRGRSASVLRGKSSPALRKVRRASAQRLAAWTAFTFAVWAPNAQRVSVVGDFNGWDGRVNPMRRLLGSGVWELFLPGVGEGAHYKFEIRTPRGAFLLKSDPFGFFSQYGKQTSSLVYNLERYQWSDREWMEARRGAAIAHEPDQHLRSASRFLAAQGRGGKSFAELPGIIRNAASLTWSRWATPISS